MKHFLVSSQTKEDQTSKNDSLELDKSKESVLREQEMLETELPLLGWLKFVLKEILKL